MTDAVLSVSPSDVRSLVDRDVCEPFVDIIKGGAPQIPTHKLSDLLRLYHEFGFHALAATIPDFDSLCVVPRKNVTGNLYQSFRSTDADDRHCAADDWPRSLVDFPSERALRISDQPRRLNPKMCWRFRKVPESHQIVTCLRSFATRFSHHAIRSLLWL
jgi:hypothetical protein